MRLEYSKKFNGTIKTIIFKGKNYSLGIREDIDGNKWDVNDYMGNICHARLVDNSPLYSTATWDMYDGYDVTYDPHHFVFEI